MRTRQIENVMVTDPAAATPETGFVDLVRLMTERGVGALPVVDADGHVLGVVSESDLIAKESVRERPRAALALLHRHAERVKSRGTTAGELMTSPAVTVPRDATVPHAARLMADHRVRRLPVVDADGVLVGVVDQGDLLRVFLRPDDAIAEEIAAEVFLRAMGLSPAGVAIRVDAGLVHLDGQVERRSWVAVIDSLTRSVDGVVDLRNQLTYQWDDTGVTIPEAMVVDITHEPR
ncbi:CBS domain-containing protein [Actinokineospora globicatena]|uniref:CBS domain-containing protein n=1 Tax=Actinokineospora globicatena TaxID=103729 RepID=UPI0020A61779|nr:CBS domain-containing protein [Actinokineospora globicatena]MCP2306132.1 BON domain-containing protein [Actinokineospora globicatena]GLW79993.1 hypothetical protein Aglo01_44740 [Actinokineospora globicatena]GLW86822.1 hypothetical protein Aglo02_44610 [Actinokineospora globicatena]